MLAFGRKLLLGFAAALLFMAGTCLADETRVIFVTHGQAGDPYWQIIINGMNDAAGKLGVNVEYHSPARFNIAEMQRMIADAVAKKPDGLVVSSPDTGALTPSITAATAAGIPVIMIDSGGPTLAKKVGALFFMGQSEFGAGIDAGRRARDLGAKHALCINHEVGNVSLEARCHGFSSGLGYEADELKSSLDPAEMKQQLKSRLAKNPKTDFILTLGAASAEAALDVVEETGLVGKVTLGTFDMSPKVLAAVADGKMAWCIDAQPYLMGYVPVVTFNLLTQYKLLPVNTGLYATGPSFIEKKDASAMIELAHQAIR